MLRSSAKNKIIDSIEIHVVDSHNWNEVIKTLLQLILIDYCKRFNTKVIRKQNKVSIALVNYSSDELMGEIGITYQIENNQILVQVHDPYLDGLDTEHPYVNHIFINTLCHELVHVCQYLTQRGKHLEHTCIASEEGMLYMNVDSTDTEAYYFDPCEIEARLLADFYMNSFAIPLIVESNGKDPIRYRNRRVMARGK
jgi:hypothetical protein